MKRKKNATKRKTFYSFFLSFNVPACLPAYLLAFFCFLRTQFSINSAFYVHFFLFASFSVCSFHCNVICWCAAAAAAIAGSAFVVHSCYCRSAFCSWVHFIGALCDSDSILFLIDMCMNSKFFKLNFAQAFSPLKEPNVDVYLVWLGYIIRYYYFLLLSFL